MSRWPDPLAGLCLAALLVGAAGCAATAATARAPEPPPQPPARAAAAPRCLTVADGELACARPCAPLQPVIARCARALAPDPEAPVGYRVVVEATSTGAGPVRDVRTRLPSGAKAGLEPAAACLRSAFRRYVPCVPVPEGQKITVPLRLVPPAPR